jgi:hypothetical protein
MKLAKEKAKVAIRPGTIPQTQLPRARSTTLNITLSKHSTIRGLLEMLGNTPKELMQHCQVNTHDSSTINCYGRKLVCLLYSEQVWQD